jgi:hypothetical protein
MGLDIFGPAWHAAGEVSLNLGLLRELSSRLPSRGGFNAGARLREDYGRKNLSSAEQETSVDCPSWLLLADAELLDHVFVALGIMALEVVQQTTTPAHHHEKSATGRVVLLMGLEMLGQFANPLAQYCDLDLWAAGVGRVCAVLADYALFLLAG